MLLSLIVSTKNYELRKLFWQRKRRRGEVAFADANY